MPTDNIIPFRVPRRKKTMSQDLSDADHIQYLNLELSILDMAFRHHVTKTPAELVAVAKLYRAFVFRDDE